MAELINHKNFAGFITDERCYFIELLNDGTTFM